MHTIPFKHTTRSCCSYRYSSVRKADDTCFLKVIGFVPVDQSGPGSGVNGSSPASPPRLKRLLRRGAGIRISLNPQLDAGSLHIMGPIWAPLVHLIDLNNSWPCVHAKNKDMCAWHCLGPKLIHWEKHISKRFQPALTYISAPH